MSPAETEVRSPDSERTAARRWLGLALLVLVLAGLFALAVVVGRMPPFDRYVTDPLPNPRSSAYEITAEMASAAAVPSKRPELTIDLWPCVNAASSGLETSMSG